MKEKNIPIHTITLERSGKTYQGSYTVDRGLLTVTFGMATKSDLLSGLRPDSLAVLLLGELVEEHMRGC
jgi:hypothetical protein